ncbi:ATP sulfurylase 2 [Camellia lanceoleosa]|uniref:ATP sulfurylase 2 n=1 Tax=Camellia lanceoleosa TaxID=1840588 RepID=A0ACC0IHL2_9ERIC|nr:ATP sulfurylase 2 [Camellia lanceoleosa]
MSCVDCSAKNPLAVKSSLIDPDGGSLVDLMVSESQMDLKTLEAQSMPKLKITKWHFIDICESFILV